MLATVKSFAAAMENTIEIPARLNMICAHFDITLNRLATKSGVHYNTLLHLRDGISKTISGGTAAKICAAYPVNEDFVQFGRGEMLKSESTQYSLIIQQMAEKIAMLEKQIALFERNEKLREENAYLQELKAKGDALQKQVDEAPLKRAARRTKPSHN